MVQNSGRDRSLQIESCRDNLQDVDSEGLRRGSRAMSRKCDDDGDRDGRWTERCFRDAARLVARMLGNVDTYAANVVKNGAHVETAK
eukprot:396351-Rhodomonas_salina.1